jgi:Subtilase family
MRPPTPARTLLATLTVALSLAVPAAAGGAQTDDLPPLEPTAVMGFIDSGINPYHVTFRDEGNPWSYEHPSTYIPGYPKEAIALPITLDEPDFATAVRKDCALWKSVERGKLYWFPGTKIVGAISFIEERDFDCNLIPQQPQPTRILDNVSTGHGTMVASRGASVEYGACRECRIVAAQIEHGLEEPEADFEAVRWTADAGWIDVQSNSWASMVPVWEPTGAAAPVTASPGLVRAAEYAAQKHPSFWATMNGFMHQGGVLGHPSMINPHFGPSVIAVGGHDSGYITGHSGSNAHVIHDVCGSWAASHASVDHSGVEQGSGTSSATPYVAGQASRLMIEARNLFGDLRTGMRPGGVVTQGDSGLVPSGPLADGVFTVAELRDVLFKTATSRPLGEPQDGELCEFNPGEVITSPQHDTSPVKWTDLPAEFPEYTIIGYGAVDRPAMDLAIRVLHGQATLPDRTEEDRWFAVDQQIRSAKYLALQQGPG